MNSPPANDPPAEDRQFVSEQGRSLARELALKACYAHDISHVSLRDALARVIETGHPGGAQDETYASTLVNGVDQQFDELDQAINAASHNWSVGRMGAIDRNLMRIAAWEMLYGGIPPQVAIAEALNLAAEYGDAGTRKFINGVLDAIARSRASG
ncbi:MAG: Transcription antitermination protein NusB [Myxococcota bacterium]|nr:Transcription antitermination protein NusB [Myxococcota bacterium]